jgi:putative acetyltransferase
MAKAPEIDIRPEEPGDEAGIARVDDDAFGQPDESRLVDALRRAGHRTISLVAVDDAVIVGHILFSPVSIEPNGWDVHALGLGPMAVLPDRQRQGIGSRLVIAGLQECRRHGCAAVVVVGHPEFYRRFGFQPGHVYGLRCEYDVPADVFMVAELTPGALAGREGLVRYLPEFQNV